MAAVASVRNVQSTEKGAVLQEQGITSQGDSEVDAATSALSNCLENLVVSELAVPRMSCGAKMTCCVPGDGGNLETRYTNSYENVMKRSAETESRSKRAPFKPNR